MEVSDGVNRWGSVGEVRLQKRSGDPAAKQQQGEGSDHRGRLGARSLGRLSTKATIAVRMTTRPATALMAAV
jgi:hypothetical protein